MFDFLMEKNYTLIQHIIICTENLMFKLNVVIPCLILSRYFEYMYKVLCFQVRKSQSFMKKSFFL